MCREMFSFKVPFTHNIRPAFWMTLYLAILIILFEAGLTILLRIDDSFDVRPKIVNRPGNYSDKSKENIKTYQLSNITAAMTETITTTSPRNVTGDAIINPHDYAYIILETSTCQKDNDKVYLLIIVSVGAARLQHRETIRNTWASLTKEHKDVRLVFMLGSVNNSSVQASILNESSRFHDIIQEDFIDHYRNLTLKSIAILKWATLYCPQTSYVMKVDDDVFVNIPQLLNVFIKRKYKRAAIGFKVLSSYPIRYEKSKWYVSKQQFASSAFPVYVAGPCYVLSFDIVPDLYAASLRTPEVPVEDVYVTGICRQRIKADVVGLSAFRSRPSKASGCVLSSYIAVHLHRSEDLKEMWNNFQKPSLICH